MEKVLIVDDSPMVHHMLKRLLESKGLEVCGVGKNGREGVKLYRDLQPDIVFMDVTMPLMDGIAATKAIKQTDPDAKIAVLTAMGDQAMTAEARSAGASVVLKKPFKEQEITWALSMLTGRK